MNHRKFSTLCLGIFGVGLGATWVACGSTNAEPTDEGVSAVSKGVGGGGGAEGRGVAGSAMGGAFLAYGVSLDDIVPFSAASNSLTKVPYAAELYDDLATFDVSAHTFQPRADGYYRICASLGQFEREFELHLVINGEREKAFAVSKHGAGGGCRTVPLKRTDVVHVGLLQHSGNPVAFPSNPYWDWLTIERVDGEVALNDIVGFSAPSGVFTKVPYASVVYGSNFDTSMSRFTASGNAQYQICASLASFTVDFEIDLYVNGMREKAIAITKNGVAQGCRFLNLNLGDYVEVWTYQGSNTVMALQPNPNWNWLTIDRAPSYEHATVTDARRHTVDPLSFTVVGYNALESGRGFNPEASQFRASQNGDYQVCASLATFSQEFELDLFVNEVRENAFAVSNYGAAQGCRTVRLHANDAVDVRVYTSPAEMLISPNPYWNWVNWHYLSPH